MGKPIENMIVEESVETYGSVGKYLVKGIITELVANAISIKSEDKVGSLTIRGDIVTYGENVTNYALEGGVVKQFNIDGEIIVYDENSQSTNRD